MVELSNLQKEMDQKKMYDVATVIRKYQDYKVSIAVEKLSNTLSLATKKNYLSAGTSYIKTGKKQNCIPTGLYRALDKVLEECVQPLRPSNEEKRREWKRDFTKKDNIPPVARMKAVKNPITVKIKYGVKVEDSVRLLTSYDEAAGFLKGLKYMGNTLGKLVSFEDLKEEDEK